MTKRAILLQALASTQTDLARVLEGIDDSSLRRRPAPDSWSLADGLNHLVYVEVLYLQRLKRVVGEERPLLPEIHPNEAAHDPGASADDLLTRFEQVRGETLAYLAGLPPGIWQRPAVHETLGKTTLRYLVQMLQDHDTQHLSQMVKVKRWLRDEVSPVGG